VGGFSLTRCPARPDGLASASGWTDVYLRRFRRQEGPSGVLYSGHLSTQYEAQQGSLTGPRVQRRQGLQWQEEDARFQDAGALLGQAEGDGRAHPGNNGLCPPSRVTGLPGGR
jgi:hypothetical protein